MMPYILLVLSILLFSAGIAGYIAAPYVPTRKKDVDRFLTLAELKRGDLFYDLGCGDGRIPKAAAEAGAKAVGFEISILNYYFCKIFRRGFEVKFKNFYTADYHTVDAVYMFLSQSAHNKMGEILRRQMKKGSKIITYVWPIEGMVPARVDRVADYPNLFLYVM
ncbi:MAG: hypothetical protein WC459_03140 [Patescibacteria group bacterium]